MFTIIVIIIIILIIIKNKKKYIKYTAEANDDIFLKKAKHLSDIIHLVSMDFQLYDYSENNFTNERFHDLKNSWAIPSDGSMESNEEYFNWTNDLKLALSNSKQYSSQAKYVTTGGVEHNIQNTQNTQNNQNNQNAQKIDRKRKYFCNSSSDAPRKLQIVDELKDPLQISAENAIIEKSGIDKRENGL